MESNKLWYLKRINLLRRLSLDERKHVDRVAQHRSYQRRELLLGPEVRGDAVYLVRRGRVKLSRFDATGREITLAVLEEGELFGEEPLSASEQREGLAEALDETEVSCLARPAFEHLLESNGELALAVARQMGERLLGAAAGAASLARGDLPARLAGALLELADRHGEVLPSGATRIVHRVTRQELATLVASTWARTTSLLEDLQRKGWVDAEGPAILLTDVQALATLARA